MATVSVLLELFRFDNCFHVECPKCSTALLLHQPDVDWPDQMIGICCNCQVWYLLDLAAGLMAVLPDLGSLGIPDVVPPGEGSAERER
jgi:hypothetical protein